MIKKINEEQLKSLMQAKIHSNESVNIVSNDPFVLVQARYSNVPNVQSFRQFLRNGEKESPFGSNGTKGNIVVLMQRKPNEKKSLTICNALMEQGYKHIVEYTGSLSVRKCLPRARN